MATIYLGHMAPDCSVTTMHLDVTDTSALLDQLIPALYPGRYGRHMALPSDPAAGATGVCVRYEELNAQLPQVIAVAPAGDAEGCTENGTSRIFIATLV